MLRSILSTALVAGASLFAWSAPPAHPAPGDAWEDPQSGMTFRYVPAGTFEMGTAEEGNFQVADQKPRHAVTFTHGFWLGQREVSTAQWKAVLGRLPAVPDWVERKEWKDTDPVVWVSWQDTRTFLGKLNAKAGGQVYRLPTEAEWEYASEAGTPPGATKGMHPSSTDELEPSLRPNAWGLEDMLGSVREWCSDWFGPYPATAQADPQGPASGRARINRGGSTRTSVVQYRHIHPTWRWYYTPEFKDDDLGFRVVRKAE